MAYQSFEDLDVWKRACRPCLDVYEALKGCNDHGLKDAGDPSRGFHRIQYR
jgi:hypothetical protein